jgi:hypothetical protein
MDRHTRSTVARRRIAGALAAALCAAGCSNNSYVIYGSGSPAAGAPTGGTSAYVQGSTSSSSGILAAVFLLHWSLLNERWDRNAGMYGSSTIPAPPMDETRAVNMQDCTQPIVDWSANLKCR